MPQDYSEEYHFYLNWLNPDTANSVVYDGVEAKAYAKVTPPADWSSDAAIYPTVALELKLRDNTSGLQGTHFDTHPGSQYQHGDAAEDVQQGGQEDIEVFSDYVDTDICTEKWYLSTTAIACVEMKIKLRRKRLTTDTAHDIELNYSHAYDMTAIIGRTQD